MNHPAIERLEDRQLFQVSPLVHNPVLTVADVTAILGQAASQARPTQAIVVEDRNGNVLGEYDGAGLVVGPSMTQEEINEIRLDAALRGRTASFFESQGEAFTTRTARFIIQDHFPTQIKNTPGGPLYGVQFSSAAATDVIPVVTNVANSPIDVINPATGTLLINALGPAGISGDPGGVPIYLQGLNVRGNRQAFPVGSIGVAGDMGDTAARSDLVLGNSFQYAKAANPNGTVFNGKENRDFDESVALAGAGGYMAPRKIRADNVFVGGLRLPYVASPVARQNPTQSLAALLSTGAGTMAVQVVNAPAPTGVPASIGGNNGTFVRRNTRADATQANQNYGIVQSNDTDPNTGAPLPQTDLLTPSDVTSIITDAVKKAMGTRAGIRNPIGANAVVYVSVVDRDGDLLGSFRMGDATNFSYDVSVQKARTAAFFSDNTHAFSDRAIGFISQRYFAPGINSALAGPMFHVQNGLKFADQALQNGGVQIVDDTLKSLGTVTAAVADPTIAPIPVSARFQIGQIITFGTDTSHEYLITSATPGTIGVRLDGIDPGPATIPALTAGEAILPKNPLKNGITIFPGGAPLYKNGQIVGAIGVSGDGVDQDDIIAYAGTAGYRPRPNQNIRSDQLTASNIANYIGGKLQTLEDSFILGSEFTQGMTFDSSTISAAERRLAQGLSHERLPYVKFPRNPNV